MEATLKHRVAEALVQAGCLWTNFDVSLGRGRNRADVVGYGLRGAKETPLVVADVQAAVDLTRAKQGMVAAEFLRASHYLMTDGNTWVWYERVDEDWRRLVNAPQLMGVSKKELSEDELSAVLWRCADILRSQPNRSLWGEFEKIVSGFLYWSRHQEQFQGPEMLLSNPGATLHDALSAMNPAQEQHPAERPVVDPLAMAQTIRLLYHSRVHEVPVQVLLNVMLELRERFTGRMEGAYGSPAQLTASIAHLVSAIAPSEGAILDPTCGSGGFLAAIGAARKDLTLVGIDILPEASRLGQALLTVADRDNAFYCANVLKDEVKGLPKVSAVVSGHGGFDVVVMDPPLGVRVQEADVLRRFEVQTRTAEGLFMERSISLLKPGGYLLMVVTPGLLFRGPDRAVREYLLRETHLEAILEIPPSARPQTTGIKLYLVVARKKGAADEPTPEVMMSAFTEAGDSFADVLQRFIDYRERKAGQVS